MEKILKKIFEGRYSDYTIRENIRCESTEKIDLSPEQKLYARSMFGGLQNMDFYEEALKCAYPAPPRIRLSDESMKIIWDNRDQLRDVEETMEMLKLKYPELEINWENLENELQKSG